MQSTKLQSWASLHTTFKSVSHSVFGFRHERTQHPHPSSLARAANSGPAVQLRSWMTKTGCATDCISVAYSEKDMCKWKYVALPIRCARNCASAATCRAPSAPMFDFNTKSNRHRATTLFRFARDRIASAACKLITPLDLKCEPEPAGSGMPIDAESCANAAWLAIHFKKIDVSLWGRIICPSSPYYQQRSFSSFEQGIRWFVNPSRNGFAYITRMLYP